MQKAPTQRCPMLVQSLLILLVQINETELRRSSLTRAKKIIALGEVFSSFVVMIFFISILTSISMSANAEDDSCETYFKQSFLTDLSGRDMGREALVQRAEPYFDSEVAFELEEANYSSDKIKFEKVLEAIDSWSSSK